MEVLSYGNKFLDQKATSLRQSLRSGGFVRIQVISGRGTVYQVKISGQIFPVKSEVKLNPGDILVARVIKHPDKLELEIRQHATVQEKLNLPSSGNSPLVEAIIRGLMSVRASLDPQLIKRLLSTSGEDKRLLARLAGLYTRKGIDLTEQGWEPLIEFLAGKHSFDGSESRQGRSGQDRKGTEGGSAGLNSFDEEVGSVIWEPGREPNLYHLVNHITSPEGLTLVLPLRAVKIGVEISGQVVGRFGLFEKMEEAQFFLKNPQGIWRFFLRRDDGTDDPGYNLSCIPPEGMDRRNLKEVDVFKEKLSNLRVKFDDNRVEEPEEDDIPGGVDWIV